jgi:predicted O-linked N-acetylglucosamine transferase (SPINDLY family)
VSPDFRQHVLGRNILPLFEHHRRGDFEIICYAAVSHPDELTEEFRKRSDQWRNILELSDDTLAKTIWEDRVDILVDLAQHSAGNRLPVFAREPAPLQVSFGGYPESTGLDAIKYRISDRWLESEIGDGRSEQVFLLESFWCYEPCGANVAVNPLPALQHGRITFGCLHHFSKLNEPTLRLWAKVIRRLPDSRLVMLAPPGGHRQRVLDILLQQGIAAHRIQFAEPCSREAYLELYHRLDIVLDTLPYNGHTTNLDALWMGVPVVSRCGQTRVSRGGLSILNNAGLPELVAHSDEEFVDIAAGLALDLPRLTTLRQSLRTRLEASVLMDAPRFTRDIEAVYRTLWRQWCERGEAKYQASRLG